MGTLTVTGLNTGQTDLNINAGEVSATVPVTVLEPVNLFPDIPTFTKNGVSVTNNGDGTLIIAGTATAGVGEYRDIELDAGRYKTEGCFSSWSVYIRFRNQAGQWILQGNGTFTLAERTVITMHLLVNQGYPGTQPVTLAPKLTRIGDATGDDPGQEDIIL